MTVSSGFFNSVNHDRLYDAEQMSSIFDGIIEDGVYESIGEAFMVTAYADANDTVIVGTGRAWFDHTWTLNDTQFSITLDPPNTLLGRIDTIVIDVDRREEVRANSIKLVKGSYSESPVAPTLINEELHKQYPIAKINIVPGYSAPISQSNIDYLVGKDCPLVTGPLTALNVTNYFKQMESDFNIWFEGIKDILNENVAGELQDQIDGIKEDVQNLKDTSISPDDFDAVANVSITSTQISPKINAATTFLPDGNLFVTGIYASDSMDSVENGPYGIYCGIMNDAGVYIKKQKIKDLNINEDNILYSSGRSYNGVEFLGVSNTSEFPIDIYVAYHDYSYHHVTKPTSMWYANINVHIVKISVSSDHVISFSESSILSSDLPSVGGNTFYNNALMPLSVSPITFDDNSYVIGGALEYSTYPSSTYYAYTVRVSSDHVPLKLGISSNSRTVNLGIPILIKSSNYSDRFSLALIDYEEGNVPRYQRQNFIFSNDLTFLGYLTSDGTSTNPYSSAANIQFEKDPSKIQGQGEVYFVSNDGKTISTNNGTLSEQLTSEVIRPYIEANRSLLGLSSPGTYVKSIITNDKSLLVAGYQQSVRMSYVNGGGFMLFSDPVASTMFSDVSSFNSLMFFSNCQWVSSDKKVYKILLKAPVLITPNEDPNYEILSLKYGTPGSIITIRLGE